jgi:hypothetical protein
MGKRVLMSVILGAVVASAAAAPVSAGSANVERLANIATVLPVRMEADFPISSLMRATCTSLIRVERPNGSSIEIQDCQLTAEPVMIPDFQGVPPKQAFLLESGPCIWHSDYWFAVAELDVMAEHVRLTVTPSGHVHVRSEYPAEPLACG